jgi:diguanylate cyclase (GGDEF)-like protein
VVLAALLGAGWLYRRNRALKSVLDQVPSTLAPADPPPGPLLQDAATGCFSRDYLVLTLPREIERAARAATPVGLALLRVDNWAAVSQAEGRPAGHALLRALAGLIAQQQPAGAFAVRWEDAVLAWVLPGLTAEDARTRAQQVATQFGAQSTWSGLIEVRGTASIAVAGYPQDAADAGALIARARQGLGAG